MAINSRPGSLVNKPREKGPLQVEAVQHGDALLVNLLQVRFYRRSPPERGAVTPMPARPPRPTRYVPSPPPCTGSRIGVEAPGERRCPRSDRYDVVVVGAGPPARRPPTAGGGRTPRARPREEPFPREDLRRRTHPRAVRQLHDIGLAELLDRFHRFDGCGRSPTASPWSWSGPATRTTRPTATGAPARPRRDGGRRAVKAGATLWQATEAVAPLVEGGLVAGGGQAQGQREHRVGAGPVPPRGRRRQLPLRPGAGHGPGRRYPSDGHPGYFESPGHDEPWIESHLDLRDRHGDALPGYGWIFPWATGRERRRGPPVHLPGWKAINTSHLMEAFVQMPRPLGLGPDNRPRDPTGGRLPMGNSVEPAAGPLAGVRRRRRLDQPVQRRGHRLRYETGRRPPRPRRGAAHGTAWLSSATPRA